jgi:hypothetical protein
MGAPSLKALDIDQRSHCVGSPHFAVERREYLRLTPRPPGRRLASWWPRLSASASAELLAP